MRPSITMEVMSLGRFSPSPRFGPDVKCLSKRLVNLNSQVYGTVYFPVRSNSLKALGKFLGASWTAPPNHAP